MDVEYLPNTFHVRAEYINPTLGQLMARSRYLSGFYGNKMIINGEGKDFLTTF